ncbi:AfsR/SARP family transcriptional regulator [Fodinicola feengrottensis]|uniref:AfsR/SARP family transcriptional regulator n=1 Tax=Fodinicola feengrottensis TaxID=435914 RepID=UPI0013D2C609|nr:hypothetical protein [Fodinicola feengrottensis]
MATDGITFSLLGPLEVRHRGELVVVPARMQRALLACLLDQAGSSVSLTTIAAQLWAGAAPKTAPATIRNYVRRARALLPEPVLRQVSDGYQLAISPEQLDTHRFAAMIARARAARSADLFARGTGVYGADHHCRTSARCRSARSSPPTGMRFIWVPWRISSMPGSSEVNTRA